MRERNISDIRAFNRFYTNVIGLLDQHVLNSKYSLPEVRILYELYHQEDLTASDIITSIRIDKGYLSRIIRQFEKKKLITKAKSSTDARSLHLRLTKKGRSEFEVLNDASHNQIKDTLEPLTDAECDKLTRNMTEIQKILSKTQK
ncbi:MAG: MarR family transcriptional regulator [Bacteroidetes bacterium]|nr:MarR family transcriptional regulator [Bacteroidota bacterium]